ncbi:MAG: porin [Myxococcota bacterium]
MKQPARIRTFRRLASLAVCALGLGLGGAAHADEADPGDEADLVTIDGGAAQVSLYGYLQGQIAPWTGDDTLVEDGDPADRPGFRLRRARFGFTGWAWGMVDFGLTAEMAGESVELLDAWVGYRRFDVLGVVLGAQKVPFSRFALYSSARQSLSQRPLASNSMAPFRQVGLSVQGEVGGMLTYAVGVYNGFERQTNFFEGYAEDPAFDGNRFERLAYAARVTIAPLGPLGEDMADLEGGALRVGAGTALYYNDGETTQTTGWEADVHLKAHGFHLAAEYLGDKAEPQEDPTTPSTIPADLDRRAVVGEVGYMVLPAELGVTARGEWIDDDTELDNNGDQVVFTGGLQYYWHRHHLKATLEYMHRTELHGPDRDNDSVLMQLQLAL